MFVAAKLKCRGPQSRFSRTITLSHLLVDVAGTPVQLVNNIELLGVTLDTNLTMWQHTKRVSHSVVTVTETAAET